jgi:hypothetical protein
VCVNLEAEEIGGSAGDALFVFDEEAEISAEAVEVLGIKGSIMSG